MHLTERRKTEHIAITISENVDSKLPPLFECIFLIHRAIPEVNLEEVDLSTIFLGKKINAPIIIAGMTGGSELGGELNRAMARAAQSLGLAMGVGSQRAALEDPSLKKTFSVVREEAPDIPVIANIGASQLVKSEDYSSLAAELIDMVSADAVAIHLNSLHEAVQPEGEPHYKGVAEAIKDFVKACPKPVIVKETGCGVSKEDAAILVKTGIHGIDVGGMGGTSFAMVEALRAKTSGYFIEERVANTFGSWGIPTAASILEVRSVAPSIPLIATGGIRSGLDAAKALRIGADFVGIARPVIKAAFEGGYGGVKRYLTSIIRELKVTTFLVGAHNIDEIKRKPAMVVGPLREWIKIRKLEGVAKKLGLLF